MVRLEGLGKLKKFNDRIQSQTCNLPASSTASQPSTLLRVPPSPCVLHEEARDGFVT
jgi:hypothetical protein